MGRAVLVRLWRDEVCAAQIGSVGHKLVRGMTCWSNLSGAMMPPCAKPRAVTRNSAHCVLQGPQLAPCLATPQPTHALPTL